MNRISRRSLRRRWSSIQRSLRSPTAPSLSETHERGKKVVRFADTIKMSTYLVAFIVGRIEADRSDARSARLRFGYGLSRARDTSPGLARTLRQRRLQFFESYYGIPYPGDKLDLLAIPDFASGAMENLGAITFRETALLVDQRARTHGELERVADVVAHENAHMWFGDLVTMSWWNGLWLNEAFATFMEMLAVDAWKPEWKRWDSVRRLARRGLFGRRTAEYESDRISRACAQGRRRHVRRADL